MHPLFLHFLIKHETIYPKCWIVNKGCVRRHYVFVQVKAFTDLMARSHWRFFQASDFLGSEAIYLDIFTLAIFPRDFYIYFICLLTKILPRMGTAPICLRVIFVLA